MTYESEFQGDSQINTITSVTTCGMKMWENQCTHGKEEQKIPTGVNEETSGFVVSIRRLPSEIKVGSSELPLEQSGEH